MFIASKKRAAIKDREADDLKILLAILGAASGSSLCAVSTLLQLEYNSFYGYQ
jgi:hypothetical protein